MTTGTVAGRSGASWALGVVRGWLGWRALVLLAALSALLVARPAQASSSGISSWQFSAGLNAAGCGGCHSRPPATTPALPPPTVTLQVDVSTVNGYIVSVSTDAVRKYAGFSVHEQNNAGTLGAASPADPNVQVTTSPTDMHHEVTHLRPTPAPGTSLPVQFKFTWTPPAQCGDYSLIAWGNNVDFTGDGNANDNWNSTSLAVGTPCPPPTTPNGSSCSTDSTCTNGHCVGGTCCNVATCAGAATDCQLAASCSTGTCQAAPRPDGTACASSNPCVTGMTCGGGSCSGGTQTSCAGSTDCQVGTCNPQNGQCSVINRSDGIACSAGSATGGTCSSGQCVGAVVRPSGLLGWGLNWFGDGRRSVISTTPLAPVFAPPDAPIFKQIALGRGYSVAVGTDGRVWSWGSDSDLGLGDPNALTTDRVNPAVVAGLPPVIAVAVATDHVVALDDQGNLYTWGSNDQYQLGTGDTVMQLAPTRIYDLGGFTAISASGSHSLALRYDGTVWEWGVTGVPGDTLSVPTKVAGLANIISIAAGSNFSVALRADGTIWTWGANDSGQLGNLSVGGASATPSQIWPSYYTSLPIAIAAGRAHALALTSNGQVFGWGDNSVGQLLTTTGSLSYSSIPVHIPMFAMTAISAGDNHSVAQVGGMVFTWGANNAGQLGDGTRVARQTVVQVTAVSSPVSAVVAGGNSTAVLIAQATGAAWGQNGKGMLASGPVSDTPSAHALPLLVGIKSIVSRCATTYALMADGSVYAWGENQFGQVGDGTLNPRNFPVKVASLGGVKQIAAGCTHAVALRMDGTIYTWGSNSNGQLSRPNVAVGTYSQWPGVAGGTLNGFVRSVSAGYNHSQAVRADGVLYSWGSNSSGMLGTNNQFDSSTPVPLGTPNPGLIKEADGGELSSMALTAAGEIVNWGDDTYGQILDLAGAPFAGTLYPSNSHEVAAQITSSPNGGQALVFGELASWGDNWAEQLGSFSGPQYFLMRPWNGPAYGYVGTAAGSLHNLAVTSQGAVWAWGDNTHGQLGDGTFVSSGSHAGFPGVQVQQLPIASGVAAGANTSYAVIP